MKRLYPRFWWLALVLGGALMGCTSAPAGGADAGGITVPCPDDAGTNATSDAGTPPADGATVAVYDPAAWGPWQVGVRTFELTDASRNRTMLVDVWYPCLGDGSQNKYEVTAFDLTLAEMETPAFRDASPVTDRAWPIVLFSHGYGGVRFQSHFLTERLASHGFVVVAPDHPGNTLTDAFLGGDDAAAQSAVDRPLDVLFALDWISSGAFVPVDTTRVGVTGHSFGGWTAFEVARRDPRFTAVFPMAPGFKEGATPDMVIGLARPMLIIGGSEDGTTPFDSDQLAPYELADHPKFLLRVTGAGHLDFSNLCDVALLTIAVNDGCDPALIEAADVHHRASTVAIAFAQRFLTDNPAYDEFLTSEYVMGLGSVDFWRQP